MIKVSVLIGEPLDPASELCDNVLVLAQKQWCPTLIYIGGALNNKFHSL